MKPIWEKTNMNEKQQEFIDTLTACAAECGVTVSDKGQGHFHVKGDLLVNYYPFSKDCSAYVAGAKESIIGIDHHDVIRMAKGLAPAAWKDTLNSVSLARIMGPSYKPEPQPAGGGRRRKAKELAMAMLPNDHPLKDGPPWH